MSPGAIANTITHHPRSPPKGSHNPLKEAGRAWTEFSIITPHRCLRTGDRHFIPTVQKKRDRMIASQLPKQSSVETSLRERKGLGDKRQNLFVRAGPLREINKKR